jgi:hypothetical protein
MLRFVASILLALSAGTAAAANIDPRLAKFDVCGRFEIFHINGIQTTEADASRNLDLLATDYGNSHNEHLIAYRLAYNPTQGALLDLVDVFAQKLNEYPGATFAMIVRAFLGRVRNPLPETLADELQRILIERIRGTGYVSLNDADLARVVDRIRSQRMDGAKTLLVPHSQGNLYANSAYAVLTQAAINPVPTKSLAIVGVASPASFVAGTNGRYVNSRQDLVLYGLRKLLGAGAVLPANVAQPVTLDDPLGHNFQAIYLRPNTNARAKLLADIAAALDLLRTDRLDGLFDNGSLRSDALWEPKMFATPQAPCERPARVVWFDTWSTPGKAVKRTMDADRGALEGVVAANLQACYEKARDARKHWLTVGDTNAGMPYILCSLSLGWGGGGLTYFDAWQVYSGDQQVLRYAEQEVGYHSYSEGYLWCPEGGRHNVYPPGVASVWGMLRLTYACNR